MASFTKTFDEMAAAEGTALARWAARLNLFFLVVMFLASAWSIAATQISFGISLLFLLIRAAIGPRHRYPYGKLGLLLVALFIWSVISAAMSYDPATSLDRLRGVGLMSIFFLTAGSIRNIKAAALVSVALLFTSGVIGIFTPAQRLIGRGIEIHQLDPRGPAAKAGLTEGDTLLEAGGRKLEEPSQIFAALGSADSVKVVYHRPDSYETVTLKAADLIAGDNDAERLGFKSYNTSHYWRSQGMFSHFTTFAEYLQLAAAFAFGLIAAVLRRRFRRPDTDDENDVDSDLPRSFFERAATFLPFTVTVFLILCVAMLLTATRASQLSLMVACFVITALVASRRFLVAAIALAIPVALIGGYLVQRSRDVAFFDGKDTSTQYRLMMWRDGRRLFLESPHNFIFGIGMDSSKKHWQEFGMFDKGWWMMGHFHSTPIQLAVERGLPALLLWIAIVAVYLTTLFRSLKFARQYSLTAYAIILGSFGGMAGFVNSGFVHWNLGDSEVATVMYALMGVSISLAAIVRRPNGIQHITKT